MLHLFLNILSYANIFGSQEAFAIVVRPFLFIIKLSYIHDTNTLIGIPRLEEAAKAIKGDIIKRNLQALPRSRSLLDSICTEDEKIELITREIVQGYRAEGIGERLVESAELERVLFDVVYPLFGSRQKGLVHGKGEAEGSEGDSSCLVQ
jgi:hypothetical protein